MINKLEKYNVVWDVPSKNSSGSMPLGNGDIGINLWVEEDGDLLFYISKTDSIDEYCRLVKLGRIRVNITPNPFGKMMEFNQTLEISKGKITIKAGELKILVWVDANNPFVNFEAESASEFVVKITTELWRNERYVVDTTTGDAYKNLYGPDLYATIIEPDSIIKSDRQDVCWCHHNNKSCYDITMKLQGLESLIEKYPDPLLNRTFGCQIKGYGFVKSGDLELVSYKPQKTQKFSIAVLTLTDCTIDDWCRQINKLSEDYCKKDFKLLFLAHEKYWEDFWSKSYIFIEKPENELNDKKEKDLFTITQNYNLNRFLNACAGRGSLPIKFNGSIFTVDYNGDPDYRQWGPGYWFQNTRLIYWPMLLMGDFDLIQPFFKMYSDMLPLTVDRNRLYYNHNGTHMAETVYPWGTHVNGHFGWDREGEPDSYVQCPYLRYYWQGGIELVAMMLEYYEYTSNAEFGINYLLPMAKEIIAFYDEHYQRDESGKIKIEPTQSLETWHTAVNPLPEVAGLKCIIEKLTLIPDEIIPQEYKTKWLKMMSELPELPIGLRDGKEVVLPAYEYNDFKNHENPELYSVFPYRIFGLGKDNIEIAQNTYDARIIKEHHCWSQDDIQAALLGRTDEVADYIIDRAYAKDEGSRFPAFWEAGHDWIPDMDAGGAFSIALQYMLIQSVNDKILLLPAWPKDWNVSFKLYAPQNTTIECVYCDGEIRFLKVTPLHRKDGIER